MGAPRRIISGEAHGRSKPKHGASRLPWQNPSNAWRGDSSQMGRRRTMCRTVKPPLNQMSSVEAARALFDASGGRRDISALKMQKLVYIAHENHVAFTGKPFVSDRVEAWSNGPVFPALNEFIGNSHKRLVADACLPKNIDLDPRTKDYIKGIWDRLASRTGRGLSKDTHAKGTPWHMAMHPDRSFFQKLTFWRPIHPEIDYQLIKAYLCKSGMWRDRSA